MRKGIVVPLLVALVLVTGCSLSKGQAAEPTLAPLVLETGTPSPDSAATATPVAAGAATPTLAAIELPTEPIRSAAEQRAAAVEGVTKAMDYLDLPDVETAATVNGLAIPMDRYVAYLRLRLYTLTRQYDIDWEDEQNLSYLPDVALEVLDVRIQAQLMAQQAAANDALPTAEEIATYRDSLVEQLLASEELEDVDELLAAYGVGIETIDEVVTDTLTAQALFKLQGPPPAEEQVKASHILVATEEEAQAAPDRLAAGEDFAALAAELSIDTGSASVGGELGWFPRGAMVTEFEEAAFALAAGETSGIVKSDYGYHIIKLEDKAVRDLDGAFVQARQEDIFNENLLDWQEAASIERFILTN